MKSFLRLTLYIAALLVTFRTAAQFSNLSPKARLISQTVSINDSLINHRPFIKKGLFYFLRSKAYRRCIIAESLNIGIVPNQDSALFVITSRRTKAPPVLKKYLNADLNSAKLKEALASMIEKITQANHCDRCVDGFLNYYCSYVLDTTNIQKTLFDVKVTNNGISETKSILSPNVAKNASNIIFPLNAAVGGTYIVYQGDQLVQNGGLFYLPKNFTIKVDPSVFNIKWQFNQMQFDDGAEIDLSQRENPTFFDRQAGLSRSDIRSICCLQLL